MNSFNREIINNQGLGKCLLVDDELEIIEGFRSFLEKIGYQVLVSDNEDDALNIVKSKRPEVVALHFTEDYKRSARFISQITGIDPTVCCIYYTLYAHSDMYMAAYQAGAYAVLKKNRGIKELIEKITQGVEECNKRRNQSLAQGAAFVLMPFSKKFDEIYTFGIKEPLISLGLKCERADEIQFTGDILSQVYKRIRESRVIVADMTGRNPNVFYEVGFAHALGKETVLLTRSSADIPFDLRGINHIVYKGNIVNLRDILLERVKSILRGD